MKKLLFPLLALLAAAMVWGFIRRNAPPAVKFVRARRQTLVSTLPTNGKVEPIEWQAARAAISGLAIRVPVREGQYVAAGAALAEIADPALATDTQSAEAHVAEARANLAALESGGRPADAVEIANSLARARADLARERKELETRQRLLLHQAATAHGGAGAGRQGGADRGRNRRPGEAPRRAGIGQRGGCRARPPPLRRSRPGTGAPAGRADRGAGAHGGSGLFAGGARRQRT